MTALCVSPAGSGFRAVHRAAFGVSPLRASIPDASAPSRRCALRLPSSAAGHPGFRTRNPGAADLPRGVLVAVG